MEHISSTYTILASVANAFIDVLCANTGVSCYDQTIIVSCNDHFNWFILFTKLS